MNKKKDHSEADVKRLYITPALHKSGWEKNITMEYYFTDGRVGLNRKRGERKFADYLLFYKSNLPLAIVEAKDDSHVVTSHWIWRGFRYSFYIYIKWLIICRT